METYLIYVVQGYDFYDKEKDLYMNTVPIEVIADNEKQAVEEAMKCIKKPLYRIVGCYEKAYIK